MGYAFENIPWHEVPDEERFAIWVMQAKVRDSFLTFDEIIAKHNAITEMEWEARR